MGSGPALGLALDRLLIPTANEPFTTLDDVPYSEEFLELIVAGRSRATANFAEYREVAREPTNRARMETYTRRVEELGRRRMAESVDFQRQLLGEVLNFWLEIAAVRPRLDWSGSKPVVQLGGHGLIGAIAVQLLFDCSRTDGLVVCTSCGTPFLPGPRRPRRDRNTYCSDCGLKAASRDAATRYRQTQKYRATYDKWQATRGKR